MARPDLELPDDVAAFIERTGHVAFLAKLDPASPRYDPRFLAVVTAMARGEPPPKAASMPGLARQAADFGKALARHVAGGMEHVSPEVKAERLAICVACEHFDAEAVRCKVCACWLRKKASWALESCPIGKWGEVEA